MHNLICNAQSPIMLKDNQVFLIPPIVFEGKIYILNDKKLYFVLCEINKLSNYLQFIRDEGYQQTYRWLKKNQLLNENFLDNVSRYWLENNNFNKTYKYEIFYKDKDYKPVIPQDFWNQYFQKVLIYDFLSSQKDEFNEFVLNNLKIISIELHNIKTLKDLDIRRKFYQNNIYNYLINNYIDHKGVDLKKITGNVDLLMSAEISNDNLGLYKVGGIRSFSNYKFIRNDVKYYECVKEGTELRLELNSDLYNLKYLLNKSEKFTQAKIDFDRIYIFKILDDYFKNVGNQGNSDLHKLYIDKALLPVKESNIFFLEEHDYFKAIVLLNLQSLNITLLDSLLYLNKNEIYSMIIKSANTKIGSEHIPFGFARINV